MAPSPPSLRIGRGSFDPAPKLMNQIAGPDDPHPARTSLVADRTRTGASHCEPEAAPRVEALDAKWQSAIDAATD